MKFKIGDKVKMNARDWRSQHNGAILTIQSINPNGTMPNNRTHYGFGRAFVAYEDELTLAYNQKIVITTDGKETLARLYEDNKIVKSATAKCSPEDEFNFNIGARLAFDRLLGEEKEKQEKPKYFNGRAVCTECTGRDFTVGKIYEFVDGLTRDNYNHERPQSYRVENSFEAWYMRSGGMYNFIPLVEEKGE